MMFRTLTIACCFATLSSLAQDSLDRPLLARSVNPLTMLAYGLGEDRLGGAKMGYVDTAVLFSVVDSTKNLFKVQLSKQHSVYINKRDLKFDTSYKQKPFYLLNSWSVKGTEEGYDLISFSLDEKLPYKSWMEVSPSKIMIEIFGVQSNTNWITQLQSVKEVKNVYLNQVEDDVVRITIELNHRQHWGYSVDYRGRSLQVRVNHKPAKTKIRGMKIGIDAGHGGTNTGASGIKTKVLEKNYTIQFAQELEKQLRRKGAEIIMTRTTDTTIDNSERVLMLQKERPGILISLHLNSSSNVNVQGTSTYYKHIGFRPLTTEILDQMLDLKLKEFGNVGSFNFTLNAPTDFPNCLVEIAFLSNEEDEKKILDKKFHKAVAKKIYKGIRNFLRHAD
jgi:N-acetylmuramoyl-L-alanine amidase